MIMCFVSVGLTRDSSVVTLATAVTTHPSDAAHSDDRMSPNNVFQPIAGDRLTTLSFIAVMCSSTLGYPRDHPRTLLGLSIARLPRFYRPLVYENSDRIRPKASRAKVATDGSMINVIT